MELRGREYGSVDSGSKVEGVEGGSRGEVKSVARRFGVGLQETVLQMKRKAKERKVRGYPGFQFHVAEKIFVALH